LNELGEEYFEEALDIDLKFYGKRNWAVACDMIKIALCIYKENN